MSDPFHTTPEVMKVGITTDASGDFTTTTAKITGRLVQWRYVPAASDALDANWDLDVVGNTTGLVLLDVDNLAATAVQKTVAQVAQDLTGADVTYDGTNEIYIPGVVVVNEALDVTVAQGGNAQSGTLYLYFIPA